MDNYNEILQMAYERYKEDWKMSHGYTNVFVDADEGINGECWACLAEFADCEFQDEEYMRELLTEEEFASYLRLFK